jgi:hypothetical protein
METPFEERLAALGESSKSGFSVPRDIFQRLQFVARVLRGAAEARTEEARLLWFGANGDVASAVVGEAGLLIGRGAACDLALASPRVSRRHCVVRRFGAGRAALEIEVLSAGDSTRVNGVPLPEGGKRQLRDGDVIEVGGVAIAVSLPSRTPDFGSPPSAPESEGCQPAQRDRAIVP